MIQPYKWEAEAVGADEEKSSQKELVMQSYSEQASVKGKALGVYSGGSRFECQLGWHRTR